MFHLTVVHASHVLCFHLMLFHLQYILHSVNVMSGGQMCSERQWHGWVGWKQQLDKERVVVDSGCLAGDRWGQLEVHESFVIRPVTQWQWGMHLLLFPFFLHPHLLQEGARVSASPVEWTKMDWGVGERQTTGPGLVWLCSLAVALAFPWLSLLMKGDLYPLLRHKGPWTTGPGDHRRINRVGLVPGPGGSVGAWKSLAPLAGVTLNFILISFRWFVAGTQLHRRSRMGFKASEWLKASSWPASARGDGVTFVTTSPLLIYTSTSGFKLRGESDSPLVAVSTLASGVC